jgi:hypothetical protein
MPPSTGVETIGTVPWTCLRHWAPQGERSVGPFVVVVDRELIQHRSEMAFLDHDDVIERLRADCLHQPVCDRVRFRLPMRRPDSGDAWLCRPPIEVAASCCQIQAALGVAVKLRWIISLRSWLIKKKTYMIL